MDRDPRPLPSSRHAVLSALALALRGELGAQAALGQTLQGSNSGRSGEERAFITDVVYGTLRYLNTLDAALARHLPHPQRLPHAVRDAMRAATYEKCVRGTPPHAAVNAWVEEIGRSRQGQRLTGVANAVLRKVSFEGLDETERVGLPSTLSEQLQASLGASFHPTIAAMRLPAPLFVRTTRADAAALLERDGATHAPTAIDGVLAVRPGRPIEELAAFKAGAIQPQNPSSVAIVEHLITAVRGAAAASIDATAARLRGVRVLDVASGHGIKAAQLLQAGASVTSVEIDRRKVAIAQRNHQRLFPIQTPGAAGVEHLIHDARMPLPNDLDGFDAALVDAPCSGTGTLRAHPEIAWRWSEVISLEHAEMQLAMCHHTAERVRPGGVLVYAVCDLTLREGPGVIGRFLAAHPDWRALDLELAPGLLTKPASVGAWILPSDTGQDGFYCVALRRFPRSG